MQSIVFLSSTIYAPSISVNSSTWQTSQCSTPHFSSIRTWLASLPDDHLAYNADSPLLASPDDGNLSKSKERFTALPETNKHLRNCLYIDGILELCPRLRADTSEHLRLSDEQLSSQDENSPESKEQLAAPPESNKPLRSHHYIEYISHSDELPPAYAHDENLLSQVYHESLLELNKLTGVYEVTKEPLPPQIHDEIVSELNSHIQELRHSHSRKKQPPRSGIGRGAGLARRLESSSGIRSHIPCGDVLNASLFFSGAKRQALGPLSINHMQVSGPPEGFKRRKVSPSRAIQITHSRMAGPPQNDEQYLDADQTPTKSNHLGQFSIRNPPSLVPSEASRDNSIKSKSTTRSSSPKRTIDLQLDDSNPITFLPINDPDEPAPEDAKRKMKVIRKLANGVMVVPDSLKEVVRESQRHELDDDIEEIHFGTVENSRVPSQPPLALSDIWVWQSLGMIIDKALECETFNFSESAWNAEVHSRILNLVLFGWDKKNQLSYRDVTTARVSDKGPGASKMVDYAITLLHDQLLRARIIKKAKCFRNQSINHTAADYVRFNPIVISIETKRPGVGEDEAKTQLGFWVGAHFERLRLLCGSKIEIPVLPILLVSGHDWKMRVASISSKTGNVVVHGEVSMGDTRTRLNAYKLMASLRYLCYWVQDTYRPWFVENCLAVS